MLLLLINAWYKVELIGTSCWSIAPNMTTTLQWAVKGTTYNVPVKKTSDMQRGCWQSDVRGEWATTPSFQTLLSCCVHRVHHRVGHQDRCERIYSSAETAVIHHSYPINYLVQNIIPRIHFHRRARTHTHMCHHKYTHHADVATCTHGQPVGFKAIPIMHATAGTYCRYLLRCVCGDVMVAIHSSCDTDGSGNTQIDEMCDVYFWGKTWIKFWIASCQAPWATSWVRFLGNFLGRSLGKILDSFWEAPWVAHLGSSFGQLIWATS